MTQLGEDKLIEIFGTPEEMKVRHDHFERDVLFVWNNMPEWRKRYLDQWIAVYDETIIAVAPDLESIDRAVRKLPVPCTDVVLQPVLETFANIVPSVFRVVE